MRPEIPGTGTTGTDPRAMLLEVRNATVHYNKVAALRGVSLDVPERSVVTIIGANGAGKSTLLRAISGLEALSEGEIRFGGQRIDGTLPEKVVGLGIAQVPEGRRIFPDLTVQENLNTGAFLRRDRERVDRDLDGVFEHFPRLKERRRQWAKTLSGGEQQMLAIGRALMSNPKLLLLDEPTMGLSPVLVQESRTRSWRCASRTTPTCWRSVPSPCTVRRPSCTRTTTSAAPTWARSPAVRPGPTRSPETRACSHQWDEKCDGFGQKCRSRRSWWSRTRSWRYASRTTPTCWRSVPSPGTVRPG